MSGLKGWIYLVAYVAHAIAFLVSHFRDDMQGMVLNGFIGMLWYRLAENEANK